MMRKILLFLMITSISHAHNIIYITPGYFGDILAPGTPFAKLNEALADYGYELRQTSDTSNLDNFSFLIYVDTPEEKLQYPKEKLILCMVEPPSVIANNDNLALHEQFNKIATWRHDLVDNQRYFQFLLPLPYNLRKIEPVSLQDKEKLCVLMNANKGSSHPHELYSKRVEMIYFFEHNAPDDFDLYGKWWPAYKTYRGTVPPDDKTACFKKYKFCICYENMCEISGYITEKIFDSMRAGCVPIYWGANNIKDYVPETCFIDREKFKSDAELYRYIRYMPDAEYQHYLDNIYAYLKNDPRVDLFSVDHFVSSMLRVILGERYSPNSPIISWVLN